MKLLRPSHALVLSVLGVLTFGCNRSVTDSSSEKTVNFQPTTQSALTIQAGNSPAGIDSREPELSATAQRNSRMI
ncbi:MAG: hypothetical protein ACREBC_12910, partial [Pyrinomonadaceae bacterium]